jgi:PAT family beta-lactamase induction signal transducer AmpG
MHDHGKNPPPSRQQKTHASPWFFVPCAEFVYGLLRNYSGMFPSLIFKTLGASNAVVGFSYFLTFPLGFNVLWAPIVERLGTHRSNFLRSLLAFTFWSALLGGVFFLPLEGLLLPALLFFGASFILSVFDMAYLGYKVSALSNRELELFTGVGNAFFRMGVMAGSTFMIYVVGVLFDRTGDYRSAWGIVLLAASGLMAVAWIFLRCTLVYPPSDTGTTSKLTPQIYAKSFTDFIRQPRGWLITIYLFLAPFGEGLLAGMKTPFYIDPLEDGGLGMDLKAIGVMAPVSTTIMILTGIAGGLIVRKFGLRRCLFPLGFLMFVPNMGIALLPLFQQQASVSHEFQLFGRMEIAIFPWVWIANFIEIAGYGIAFAAYLTFTAFLIKTGGHNKATFAALVGSITLVGYTGGGGISGIIQESVGYFWTFALSIVVSIPAWLLILALPIKQIVHNAELADQER